MRINRREFLKILGLLGGALPLIRPRPQARLNAATPGGPNLLLLVFDTFSAEHMSLYGYGRKTTPQLERLSARATVFHEHYAGGNFTTAGTASLLTGTYPWTHRGLQLSGSILNPLKGNNLFAALASKYQFQQSYTHNPLAQILLEQFRDAHPGLYLHPIHSLTVDDDRLADFFKNDYEYAYWGELINRRLAEPVLPTNLILSVPDYFFQLYRVMRYARIYREQFPHGLPINSNGTFFVLDEAIDWISTLFNTWQGGHAAGSLAYVHLFPPHESYHPRREFLQLFQDAQPPIAKPPHFFTENYDQSFLDNQATLYDQYIAYVDAEIGRLFALFEQTGVLENTIIVLTSDHGQLIERGIHGHSTPVLYEPLTHIPLLIWQPGQQTRKDIYLPTSAVDILPTLMHFSGNALPTWGEGQVLPGLGGPENADRSIFTLEAKLNSKFKAITIGTVAMRKGEHKLIHYFGYPGFDDQTECFDLSVDPGELNNLYPASILARQLKEEALAKIETVNTPYR